jgi:hypothetical protein
MITENMMKFLTCKLLATVTSEHLYSVTSTRHFIQECAKMLGNSILVLDEENPAILAVIILEKHIVLCTSKQLH